MASEAQNSVNGLTIKGYFSTLAERYTAEVVHSDLPSSHKQLRTEVINLIAELEEFWCQLLSSGVVSTNEALEDCTTSALEMLWIPYVIGDLYQRLQPTSGAAAAATSKARMAGEDQLAGEVRVAGASSDIGRAHVQRREEDVRSLTREGALDRSHYWFNLCFEWMQQLELIDEATIELYSKFRPNQRMQRIDLSRKITELRTKLSDLENKVAYLRAKRKRMVELMEGDGDAIEEYGGEEEEVLRDRAVARLLWSCYDACHQLQLSSRELEMLQAVKPDQRMSISTQYQDTMDAVRRGELSLQRQTYTILPGGAMVVGTLQNPQAVPAEMVNRSGGVSAQSLSAMANQQQFRQQIRSELMMDRNPTTMTLQEFAEGEMAEMQRQTEEGERMKRMQEEEDERLGADGVEERQRKKDSEWSNWKDDNPANGPSKKGNY